MRVQSLPTLDLAVATHTSAGIERCAAMILPPAEGIRYIISWQDHGDAPVPQALMRPDVEVLRFEESGLSRNRNNAIDHCTADIILLSDDDLIYYPEGLEELRRAFAERPHLDLATLRTRHEPENRFPDAEVVLGRKLPKNYFVTCFEIALRRATAGKMRCCTEVGPGSERFHAGEDTFLLHSAIRRGYHCRYLPIVIGAHPHESTGTHAHPSAGVLRSKGVEIALVYPWSAVLRVPLAAWREHRNRKTPILRALFYITSGALAAPGVLRRNHNTLW